MTRFLHIKSTDAELHWLPLASIVLWWWHYYCSSLSLVVATFKVVTANKYKAQERLDTFIKSKKWGCVKSDWSWSLVIISLIINVMICRDHELNSSEKGRKLQLEVSHTSLPFYKQWCVTVMVGWHDFCCRKKLLMSLMRTRLNKTGCRVPTWSTGREFKWVKVLLYPRSYVA